MNTNAEDFNVDYKILKNRIIKACRPTGKGIVDFEIDYEQLAAATAELNLTPMYFGLDAHRITPELVPFLNEYFKDENLSWMTDSKFVTTISFIHNNYIDEKAQSLLDALKTPQVDLPNEDKVSDAAYLLANYPCYTAVVVSYKSNNPKFINSPNPSYVIRIRANKVIIENSNYQYTYKD